MTELTRDDLPPASRRRIKVHAASGDVEYDRARRGSRRVGRLKFILPAIAVIAIGGFLAAYALMPRGLGISMSGINISTKSLTIDKPRFSGFNGTARSYDISAARAIQDLANPKIVRLEEIGGSFGVDAGSATLSAKAGVYDSTAQLLTLKDGIAVKTSNGIAVSLEEAVVDFDKKTLTSQKPVVITSAVAKVHANGVRIDQGGRKINFENGVSVTYTPANGDGIAAPPTAQAGTP